MRPVNGLPPSGDSLQIFLKTYSSTLSAPSGTMGSYRFEDVSADGTVTVLSQGNFTEPAGPDGVQLTINATFNAGTLPNTALGPPWLMDARRCCPPSASS